jgi:hypothetical protein
MTSTTRLLLACLVGTTLSTAQNQPTGYHRVACIKVQSGKMANYRQFSADLSTKTMQAAANSRDIAGWYLLRSIAPTGEAAQCDYVSVTSYSALPPPPATREQLALRLKQAGIQMTADEFIAKRDGLSRLVSQEIWRTIDRVGEPQTGDYMLLNFGKISNMTEYLDIEQKVWKPMAEAWAKDGKQLRAWAVTVPVLPSGSDRPYQAVSLDVFPSWEAVFQPRGAPEMFNRVHPGKDYTQTFTDRLYKVRNVGRRDLLVVEQLIKAPARSSQR